MTPEQISRISGDNTALTGVGNQTLNALSAAEWRGNQSEIAREREKNLGIQNTFKNYAESIKLLQQGRRDAVDANHKDALQGKMDVEIDKMQVDMRKTRWELKTDQEAYATAELAMEAGVAFEDLADGLKFKMFGSDGMIKFKKYYQDEKKYELDVLKHGLERGDKLWDNLRDAEKIALQRDLNNARIDDWAVQNGLASGREARLANAGKKGGETAAQTSKRYQDAILQAQHAMNEEVPMEERVMRAQYYNENASDNQIRIFVPGREDNMFLSNEDTLEVAQLPNVGGTQITLGYLRKKATENSMTIPGVYRALMQSLDAQ